MVYNETIYAVSQKGIYSADINDPNLVDFNNWEQRFIGRDFSEVATFNNQIFMVEGSKLFQLDNGALVLIRDFFQTIFGIKPSESHLAIALEKTAIILEMFRPVISGF